MRVLLDRAEVVYSGDGRETTPALAPTTLSVDAGSCVAVVGPTGSGKTTLLDVMSGLRAPTSGTARLDPGGPGPELRRGVGLVAQFPEEQFFEETVFDEVAFGLRRSGVEKDEAAARVERALRRSGLDPVAFSEREPARLSAGEARRAAIAGILVLERPFLLLDEPTAGLDPGNCGMVFDLIRAERAAGTGVVFVTHDLGVALELAERVIVMVGGRVVGDDVPARVMEDVDGLASIGLEPPIEYALVAALERRGALSAAAVRRVLLG
ncbi:MAG: ATP-binding cassette domain-containing protein [Candidatus Eisenbacteria bacterium]|nr:ATP-binding cassette domain-containing protein [Candidatus Eisenbacteria bacterium]